MILLHQSLYEFDILGLMVIQDIGLHISTSLLLSLSQSSNMKFSYPYLLVHYVLITSHIDINYEMILDRTWYVELALGNNYFVERLDTLLL